MSLNFSWKLFTSSSGLLRQSRISEIEEFGDWEGEHLELGVIHVAGEEVKGIAHQTISWIPI